jgi:hypothetical protein
VEDKEQYHVEVPNKSAALGEMRLSWILILFWKREYIHFSQSGSRL